MDPIVVFVVGAEHIGKTKLLTNLTQQATCDIGGTLGIEMRQWSYKHLDDIFRFRIWDVSGNSTFSDIVSLDVQYGNIAVICYDTCSRQSLAIMRQWMVLVEQSPKKQHIILCGIIDSRGRDRQVMPSEVHSIQQNEKGRGNVKSIVSIECRLDNRVPLFQALLGIVTQ